MGSTGNNILLSMDIRPGKGGIARVARLIQKSLPFTNTLSLHGEPSSDSFAFYFNRNRLMFLKKAFSLILLKKPRVIVFDHLYVARLLAFVPGMFFRKAVIFLHDEEAWKVVTGFNRIALNKATHILCNSAYTMTLFLQYNPQYASKTKACLPGGVPDAFKKADTQAAEAIPEWISDPAPYCLFVSRLWKEHRYKGHFELLKAFREYHKDNPGRTLRLAIIGNGDDSEEVETFIRDQNLSGKAALFRDLGDRELALFYRNAQCLFFPSSREGFGMVFLEAMYFHKACIGMSRQPAEEIIVDQVTGKLLPDKKTNTLCGMIMDIEENQEKYKQFGEAGYLRYMEYFTEENFKQRFLEAIEEL